MPEGSDEQTTEPDEHVECEEAGGPLLAEDADANSG